MTAQRQTLSLTLLYVPGDRPDRIAKALLAGADTVIVDLEDAVAPSKKSEARNGLAESLQRWNGEVPVQIRINSRGSAWHDDDLAAVRGLDPRVSLRLPKAHAPDDIRSVSDQAPGRDIHALIESPLGVERAFSIASSGVSSIGLGEADLRSALGLPSGALGEPGLQWARARIVNAAAAAGLLPPPMSVYTNVRDLEGLRESCRIGRSHGFLGRAAIHPAQLPVIREAFLPSRHEIEHAAHTLERVGDGVADAAGTVVLEDGSFLDIAMVEAARRIIEISQGRHDTA